MLKIGKVIEKITIVVAYISFAAVAGMVLLNVADVLLLKIFNFSIMGAYEISQVLLQCAVFAAFAYGQSRKVHIHLTLLINTFPGRSKYIPYAVCALISAAMAAMLTYASIYQANRELTTGTISDILKFPMFPYYYVQAFGMAVFTVSLLYEAILDFMAIFSDKYAKIVSESW